MDNNIAIKAIEDKLEKLRTINFSEQFDVWQKSTIHTLINIFSESDRRVKSLEEIKSCIYYFDNRVDKTNNAIKESDELLQNLIKDIQDFGIPQKLTNSENKSGLNINVQQNNTQNQSTNISIQLDFLIEILKDELKGAQIKELKSILESEQPQNEKKISFIEKLKSFGSDVASNILANILTNPRVYEGIYGLL